MARPIKLFQLTQKWYRSFGIYPSQPDGSHVFNLKNGFFIFSWAQMGTLTGAFFVFEATRLDEFCISFDRSVTIVAQLFYFFALISQMGNIIKFIQKFEEFIAESK